MNKKIDSALSRIKAYIPYTIYHIPYTSSRGFTLLLAALVASIVLALGTSIFELAQKELTLSSTGRDSQFAFYAADTAAECALYWDVRFAYFGTTTPTVSPTCDSQLLNAAGRPSSYPSCSQASQSMTFEFAPNGYCAAVSVSKCIDPDTQALKTVIHADGFSTHVTDPSTCAVAVVTDPSALQRSVELRY